MSASPFDIDDIRKFANEAVRPYATEFDVNECMPREVINKLASKGYLAAPFPKEYGGMGLDSFSYGMLTEEIGKACCSTRALLTVHTSLVGETILRWGTNDQKDNWIAKMASGEKIGAFALSEPDVGTDARSVQTNYRKDGSAFILNGIKKWITFGDIADFFIVIAANNEEVTAFIVPRATPGVQSRRMRGMLANKATHIAEIEFSNVVVTEDCVLGKIGGGFTYIVNTALDYGRYSIAWAGLAIAQEALEAMISYARKRSQFNKKIYSFQLIQGLIGDAVTQTMAARTLCMEAAKMRNENHEDKLMITTIAKYFTSKVAMKVTADAVQVHGGNGCHNKYPVERLYREAKILEIIEGTSQIQQEMISEYGLQKYYTSYAPN